MSRRGLIGVALVATAVVVGLAASPSAWGQTPAISLNKTVGVVPGVCAATDSVTVSTGTQVYYCFQIQNTGDVTFNYHNLVDDHLGVILSNFNYTLAPGAFSPEVIVQATAAGAVTNTGTWEAADVIGGYSVDDTIQYNFEDISSTGTPLSLSDDSVASFPIGFTFDYYGSVYTTFYVSSNGFLLDNNGSNGCCSGQPMPTPGDPDGVIAGWWEDLYPPGGGSIVYQTLGSAPNRYVIVQFTNIQHFFSGNPVTMQFKLFETTGVIEVHYQAAPSDGGTHSAGIENQDGTVGLQYYLGTAALSTPLAVRYTPSPSLEAMDTDTATVNISDPDITVTPATVVSTQVPGQVVTQPLDIGNVGTADLVWDLEEAPPIEIPASDGSFPRGSAPPSIRPAPQSAQGAVSQPGGLGLRLPGEIAFAPGIDLNTFIQELYTFDTDVPGTLTVVGPAPAFYVGADFINNDFTQAYVMDADNNQLVRIDVASGAVSVVGPSVPSGGQDWTAAATDPTTNTFYAASVTCGTASNLYTINTATGTPTLVGSLGAAATCLIGIAFDADGNLYGNDIVSDTLLSINKATGAGTTIGSLGYDANFSQGMDFDEVNNILYLAAYNNGTGTGELRIANTTTGATTLVGLFGGSGLWELNSMAVAAGGPCSAPEDLPWLSVSPISGTVAPGGTDNLTVTFDSTGLAIGLYEGVLCVHSNDPDERLVEVPVVMDVVIPVELQSFSAE